MNLFISDLHFGSEEIFVRERRDLLFKDTTEMADEMIRRINMACGKKDTLYILGDVSCAEYDPTEELKQIKCQKVLVIGNHDAKWLKHHHFCNQFVKILDVGHVRDFGTRITLFHYPLCEWDGAMKGHWHFYGHVHASDARGTEKIMRTIPHCVNVGADVNDFTPLSVGELIGKRIAIDGENGYLNDEFFYPGLDFDTKDERGLTLHDYTKRYADAA